MSYALKRHFAKVAFKARGFVDRLEVVAEAGRGGHGCVSFLRNKQTDDGPANGGSGGQGGDIYVVARSGLSNLYGINTHIVAGNGTHGKGTEHGGSKGQDLILSVPLGTFIREVKDTSSQSAGYEQLDWVHYPGSKYSNFDDPVFQQIKKKAQRSHKIAAYHRHNTDIFMDLEEKDIPKLLLSGGSGGRGNASYQSPDNVRPTFASKGMRGQKARLIFELKSLADVGLVGMPNAGKSSLLRAISNATPEVADYAFTTLTPQIGTVVCDGVDGEVSFTVADIPGVIEGASQNKGLGHDFLRHIERAKAICIVIDLQHNPVETLAILLDEMRAYSEKLFSKECIIVANKADLEGTEAAMELLQANIMERMKGKWPAGLRLPLVIPVSALQERGVNKVIDALGNIVRQERIRTEKEKHHPAVVDDDIGEENIIIRSSARI